MSNGNERITITYGVDDGYVGGDRPQHVTIYMSDLEDCETDEEIETIIDEAVEDHMRQTITPYWKREQIAGLLDRVKAARGEAA